MRILRALALAVALPLGMSGLTLPVGAQGSASPDAPQVARELASLTSFAVVSELTANLTNQVWPSMEAALRNTIPTIDPATLAELRRDYERLQTAAIFETMSDIAAIYVRHFTVQEMREIIAFYSTPAGSKSLKAMPRITSEFMTAMAPRIQGLQEKVNLSMLNILQQRGYYGR
jgi:hypothetical protein